MKRVFITIVSVLFLILPPVSASIFEGTWELQSGEYINHKKELVSYSDLKLKSIKIISGSHFSFVTMADEKFWSAGAGQFEFTEKDYIEYPTYNSFKSPKGAAYLFEYKMEGDLWKTSRWENGVRVEHEVWRRKAVKQFVWV